MDLAAWEAGTWEEAGLEADSEAEWEWGLAGLEAAAVGLPVVIGRSGGAPETVRHGETGYVVDGNDPYELAARLVDLLADPDRSAALGRAGRAFVSDRFGADRARRTLRAVLALPPIDLRREFGADPDLDEVYDHLVRQMQETLDALAAERRFPVLG